MKKLIGFAFVLLSLSLSAQNNEVKTYYDNGMVKSSYRYTSARNYEVINYYRNGKAMETGRFVNGKMEGVWVTFAENGVRNSEGNYRNGEKSGEWKVYHDNGVLRYKIVYDANRIVSAVNFDAHGKAVAETHTH